MQIIRGVAIKNYIEELGRFRMEIFREYPYLYEGDMEVERLYLSRYLGNEDSILVFIKDQNGLLGACTGLPLLYDDPEFRIPFAGYNLSEIFYIGEVMVRADSRGNSIGSNLLSTTIGTIDSAKYTKISLCAVERGQNHPLRPNNYRSPDSLWQRYGFQCMENAKVHFRWKKFGENLETEKTMNVWLLDKK